MSAWETSSGRPTGYRGVVDEMLFGFDSRIKDGEELIAIIKIKPDDDDEAGVDTDDDGYVTETFTIGKGWQTRDGGETATGNKKFNKNTRYGRLIDHVITQLGSIDAAVAFFDGDPTEAKIWVGMHATWNEVNYPYDSRDEVDENGKAKRMDFFINMPFDVSKPGQSKGSGSTAKAAAEKAAPAAKGNGSVDVEGKLKKFAAAFDDHGDWVAQAMTIPGVADSDEWVAKLADEGYYLSLKG